MVNATLQAPRLNKARIHSKPMAIDRGSQRIGKRLRSTKRRYWWRFCFGRSEHCVELVVSYRTRKRRIALDGRLLLVAQATSSLRFEHGLAGHHLLVITGTETSGFDVALDSVSFKLLPHRDDVPHEEPIAIRSPPIVAKAPYVDLLTGDAMETTIEPEGTAAARAAFDLFDNLPPHH